MVLEDRLLSLPGAKAPALPLEITFAQKCQPNHRKGQPSCFLLKARLGNMSRLPWWGLNWLNVLP